MSLLQLPHELQLLIFGYLINDYVSLCNAVLISRHLIDCALEVLRKCRTLDLSAGYTDDIEVVLVRLDTLAKDDTAPAPQVTFAGTGSGLGDNLVRHGSRYKTLKLNFDCRNGHTRKGTQPIGPDNIAKFESMMKLLAGNDRYDIRTWRRNIRARLADTSLRLVLHTMRHLTTLELGGSTSNILPWNMQGVLETLHTLKFTEITNSKLPKACCRLATQPGLFAIEFSNMEITSTFLEHFKHELSIASLRFTHCWAATSVMGRVIKLCKSLRTFEYSLDATHWPVEYTYSKHHHIYRLLQDLRSHAMMLKHLTVLIPNVAMEVWQCNHVGSLAEFSTLESLSVSYRLLVPHKPACNVDKDDLAQVNNTQNAFDILAKLAPSVQALYLDQCPEQPAIETLSGIANSMGLANVLPNLCCVEVPFDQGQTLIHPKHPSQRELAITGKFQRRGVEVKIRRP